MPRHHSTGRALEDHDWPDRYEPFTTRRRDAPSWRFYAKATTAVDGNLISRGAYLTRGRGRATLLRQLDDPASGSARNRGVSLTGSAIRLVIQTIP